MPGPADPAMQGGATLFIGGSPHHGERGGNASGLVSPM